jgi:integrase
MADFAIATGLRWANVSGMVWERISLTRKLAWVPARTTKAKKTIQVPLSEPALKALRGLPGTRTGPVFLYQGEVIKSPKGAFMKACVRAGVGRFEDRHDENGKRVGRRYVGFTWHDFRHTWASWHVMRGTRLEVLQKLGGWETLEMVQVYAHLAPSYVAQFANNARPVGHSLGHRRVA